MITEPDLLRNKFDLGYSKYIFSKVIVEPSLSEFEGEKVCFGIKVFIAVIFIHMRALRDGNCGPTSAKGVYGAPRDEERNIKNSDNNFIQQI